MKHLLANNRFITIVALYAVVLCSVAFITACPKKDAVRAAIDASYRLPHATNDLTDKIRVARDRGLITAGQSANFGAMLNKIAQGEVVYVGMVKALQNAIDSGTPATAADLANLRTFFDASIIEPFLRVLEAAKVLSGDSVTLILIALTAVRLLIRKIASGIGSGNVNRLSRATDSKQAIDAASLKFENWSFA